MKEIDEELNRLIEQGLTARAIKNYFEEEKGIILDIREITRRIIIAFEQKTAERAEAEKVAAEKVVAKKEKTEYKRKSQIQLPEEEIFELREQGLTYEQIARIIAERGIVVSHTTIKKRCEKIYAEKGKEEPKLKRKTTKIELPEEEIFELREQRLNYEQIAKHFAEKGIIVSSTTIKVRCKKIYAEKGKEEPGIVTQKIYDDEELYNLREQGLSYLEIQNYYKDKGITVSRQRIYQRCKKIYKAKGKEEPDARRKKEISEEEIYNLREQGLSYEEIVKHFTNKGIEVSHETISQRCKAIYKAKGKEEPKARKKIETKLRIEIPEEEIYELREQGLSYKKIAEYFTNKGIKVSLSTIEQRCKEIYKAKGKEEPKLKRKTTRIELPEEEIYNLREKGLSYRQIKKYFTEKGIKIGHEAIRKRLKKVCEAKKVEDPKITKRRARIELPEEEIFELREQGLSYEAIAKHFTDKGIKVSYSTIEKRCKKIYAEKEKEEPKAIRKTNATTKKVTNKTRKELPDEEIYSLREQELTYKEITKHFTDKGIKVSCSTIRVRCKKIYKEKGKDEPKTIRKKTGRKAKVLPDEEIYSLREQGLSYEKIAKHFTEKGIKVCGRTIRVRCKQIYKEKGKEEPKVIRKTVRKTKVLPDEEIYSLREQGLSCEKIAKHFTEKGIKVCVETIRTRCKEIYQAKGKEEPKAIRKTNSTATNKTRKELPEEEIYSLNMQGFSYKDIAEYLNDEGIKVDEDKVKEIVIRLKHQKQKEIQIMEQDKTIYRLREQKLSYREIAEYFTKKGIMINEKQIRLRCKKIYEEKGEQEPKVKRKPKEKSLEQLEKELETLLLKKKKSQELLQRYIELEADLLSDIRKKKRGEGR